jgi:pimeloyl-ACP methyl ester carboxylesterase
LSSSPDFSKRGSILSSFWGILSSETEKCTNRVYYVSARHSGNYDSPLPREWAARHVNLVHFTYFPRGGHFVAWEEPELYAADIQNFVRQLRKS